MSFRVSMTFLYSCAYLSIQQKWLNILLYAKFNNKQWRARHEHGLASIFGKIIDGWGRAPKLCDEFCDRWGLGFWGPWWRFPSGLGEEACCLEEVTYENYSVLTLTIQVLKVKLYRAELMKMLKEISRDSTEWLSQMLSLDSCPGSTAHYVSGLRQINLLLCHDLDNF